MEDIEQSPLFLEELEMEYQFKHQAEEQLKKHLQEKTQAGKAIETPIGRGLIEYLHRSSECGTHNIITIKHLSEYTARRLRRSTATGFFTGEQRKRAKYFGRAVKTKK